MQDSSENLEAIDNARPRAGEIGARVHEINLARRVLDFTRSDAAGPRDVRADLPGSSREGPRTSVPVFAAELARGTDDVHTVAELCMAVQEPRPAETRRAIRKRGMSAGAIYDAPPKARQQKPAGAGRRVV